MIKMLLNRFTATFLWTMLLFVPYLAAASSVFPGPPLTLEELWSRSTLVGLVDVAAVKRIDNEVRVSLSLKSSTTEMTTTK